MGLSEHSGPRPQRRQGRHQQRLRICPGSKNYEFLKQVLTVERVKAYFGDMVKGEIVRYDVDTLCGMNFVMKHALGGGATHSLRLDSLGKSMGSAFMRMKIEVGDEAQ